MTKKKKQGELMIKEYESSSELCEVCNLRQAFKINYPEYKISCFMCRKCFLGEN